MVHSTEHSFPQMNITSYCMIYPPLSNFPHWESLYKVAIIIFQKRSKGRTLSPNETKPQVVHSYKMYAKYWDKCTNKNALVSISITLNHKNMSYSSAYSLIQPTLQTVPTNIFLVWKYITVLDKSQAISTWRARILANIKEKLFMVTLVVSLMILLYLFLVPDKLKYAVS